MKKPPPPLTPNTFFLFITQEFSGAFPTGIGSEAPTAFVTVINMGTLFPDSPGSFFFALALPDVIGAIPPGKVNFETASPEFRFAGAFFDPDFSTHLVHGVGPAPVPQAPIDTDAQDTIGENFFFLGNEFPGLAVPGGVVSDIDISDLAAFLAGMHYGETYDVVADRIFGGPHSSLICESPCSGEEAIFAFLPIWSATTMLVYDPATGTWVVTHIPNPEPGTLLLVAFGAAGIAARRRKRA